MLTCYNCIKKTKCLLKIMHITPTQVTALIRRRRSVYPAMYSDQPVKREIIEEMLENANWAPTHKMTEPWRFTVFTGEGLKKLAYFQSELYKKVSTEEERFEEKQYQKLKEKPLMCSHVIAIGMRRDYKVPEMEELAATACAVQNMYLTAAAYGIGCYWGTGGITYLQEAKAFFDLGESDKLLGFFHVGMLKNDNWPEGKRGSIKEKVVWVEGD